MEEEEIVGFLTISMTRITGYQKNSTKESMIVTFCMTVSSLWCNSGIINLLTEYKVVKNTEAFQNAMLPGLIAISIAFFIIGGVGTFQNQGPLSLMAFALSLANFHLTGFFENRKLGASATACNFMIVSAISLYLVAIRFFPLPAQKNAPLVKKSITFKRLNKNRQVNNPLIVTGIIANIISSGVYFGRLVGITNILFVGHVPWLWTSGLYQLIVFFTSFWAQDVLYASFFSFTAILNFSEGYCLLIGPQPSNESILPFPFMIVFAFIFLVLACMMFLRNVFDGIYTLLFAICCAMVSYNVSGITHNAVHTVIFAASILNTCEKLYISNTDVKISYGQWVTEKIFFRFRFIKLRQRNGNHFAHLSCFKNHKADITGHAFNTLAAFCIITENHAGIILLIVTGCMVHISGLLSVSNGKTLESFAFIFHGIMWVVWALIRYKAFGSDIRNFNMAMPVICFLMVNSLVTISVLVLNKAWFFISLTLQILLIVFLLNTLNILSVKYIIAFSILFGVVCFYCFLTALFNAIVEKPQLPWGEPFIKRNTLQHTSPKEYPQPANKVTSIMKIAEIINEGGLCVIPTETTNVIAASCYFPDSVKQISQLNLKNMDNEISLCISDLVQMQAVKYLFNGMIWYLIEALSPNPIGLILPKQGCWLDCLGLQNDLSYLGTCHTVTLYVSDRQVTNQVIDMVGPLAIRFLGKECQELCGQSCARLLTQVDGILLDAPFKEDSGITVVDCTQIDKGLIDVKIVGSVSKIQVMDIFNAITAGQANGMDTENSVYM
ncbi:uncharacterized LOC100489887 L homeolog [Pelobates cultripes]|uniref:Threonylcarbamoyl-AMP synthase n=1 Tax=Pelobates cultripes TaxID=61616 RepID=A0AAD1WJ43_PELCU|nr:uncharacterized LOC100489887 L homeolog [Pelobates cultripes]